MNNHCEVCGYGIAHCVCSSELVLKQKSRIADLQQRLDAAEKLLKEKTKEEVNALIEKYGDPQYKTNEFALYDVIGVCQQYRMELEKVIEKCICGRPTGLGAVVMCIEKALTDKPADDKCPDWPQCGGSFINTCTQKLNYPYCQILADRTLTCILGRDIKTCSKSSSCSYCDYYAKPADKPADGKVEVACEKCKDGFVPDPDGFLDDTYPEDFECSAYSCEKWSVCQGKKKNECDTWKPCPECKDKAAKPMCETKKKWWKCDKCRDTGIVIRNGQVTDEPCPVCNPKENKDANV